MSWKPRHSRASDAAFSRGAGKAIVNRHVASSKPTTALRASGKRANRQAGCGGEIQEAQQERDLERIQVADEEDARQNAACGRAGRLQQVDGSSGFDRASTGLERSVHPAANREQPAGKDAEWPQRHERGEGSNHTRRQHFAGGTGARALLAALAPRIVRGSASAIRALPRRPAAAPGIRPARPLPAAVHSSQPASAESERSSRFR